MKLLFSLLLLACCRADEAVQYFYDPASSLLTGTLTKEAYGEDAAPADQGRSVWILHLDRPITVNAKEGSEIDVLEKNVTEVHLSADDSVAESAAALKNSVTFIGTLYHAHTTHHLRPIVMQSSGYKPVTAPIREVRRAPDGKLLVAWADNDLGPPLGEIRSIFLRGVDQEILFSLISTPRYTDAAWNPSSKRCIIADAPDNGGPRTWLVWEGDPDASEWKSREIDPFRELAETHYAKYEEDPKSSGPLFRPSYLKIEWVSETKVRFRGYCNSGTYILTVDAEKPEAPAQVEKLGDGLLKE